MGYDLYQLKRSGDEAQDYFHLNIFGWGEALRLAEKYSWGPAGTYLRGSQEWDGGYHSNDGQVVRVKDARRLAEALRKAVAGENLGGLPVADPEYHGEPTVEIKGSTSSADWTEIAYCVTAGTKPKWGRILRNFAAFCERGSFQIW